MFPSSKAALAKKLEWSEVEEREAMITDQQVADIMWTVRVLRQEGVTLATLNGRAVYERQRHIFFHSQETVAAALREIGERGYHWSQLYSGVPDTCILVGNQRPCTIP
jgi:hypothetical protein